MEGSERPSNQENIQNKQEIDQNQGQAINCMNRGMAVKIDTLTVYYYQKLTESETPKTASNELGANPYRGLLAFRETDGDRFFGRDTQIKELWERFQQLHGDRSTIRILPIYGPSGSGKSSLARAGLIPALGKQPLPGKDQGRVVVITPGNDPLESLATVLARIATQDTTPVAKTREFKNELLQPNTQQEFDGLRRIANVFPNITDSPLIVLVDQFEELYTLCDDEQVRSAFVENLLCAASDSSQRVSVIITMRSDFLGKTQQHPRLNKLFSSPGLLVPIMQPEELAIAITEPAKRADHELDKATVQLLIEQSKDQEGALPLLQFALAQIWEGLRNEVKPIDTLEQIGGVGGALANEAKRLYHSLTPEQQTIARSTFLALIQLNDNQLNDNQLNDNHNRRAPFSELKATRRRAPFSELITSEQDAPLVRKVIERFARPGVWILVTFSDKLTQVEMVEVAHETLIRNWEELQGWLQDHWVDVLKKRKIEQAATEWQDHSKSKDYLLQGRSLRDAREFLQAQKENTETSLSGLAKEFVKASEKKQRINILKLASIFLVFPLIGTVIAVHLQIIGRANSILSRDDCKADPEIKGLLEHMWWTGYAKRLRDVKLCNENLQGIKLPRSMISSPNFDLANLSNSDFRGVIFSISSFKGATLADANFSEQASLMDADFGCKDSECANLFKTNFQNADLENANFEGASLEKTDFTNANLDEAKGLTAQQLKNAIICKTIMPNNLNHVSGNLNYVSGNRDCHIK